MERQPRILVVDDAPRNIRVMEATLAPRGYTIDGVTSGAGALLKIATEPPDLVLLDVVMPEMDGYEVCRRLRADPATRLLPVVMITASGDQEKVSALDAGADDFVQKPFNQAELLARVASLLRIKRYHDTIQQQAAELAEWNRTLERRVQEQVAAQVRALGPALRLDFVELPGKVGALGIGHVDLVRVSQRLHRLLAGVAEIHHAGETDTAAEWN